MSKLWIAVFITVIWLLHTPGLSQQYIVIDSIKVSGDSRLRSHVVVLKTGIAPGDSLRADLFSNRLEGAAAELRDMRILDSVAWNLAGSGHHQVLEWYFKKSINVFFVPYVEAADRDINVWLDRFGASVDRLNYGGLFYLFNLAGHNDVVDLSVTTGFNQDIELFYFLPNIDINGKWSALFHAQYMSFRDIAYQTSNNKEIFVDPEERDEVFRQYSAKLGLQYRIASSHWLETSFTFLNKRMNDQLFSLNHNFLNTSARLEREYNLGLRHINDTRNNRRFPTKGYRTESILDWHHYDNPGNDLFEIRWRANLYEDLGRMGLLEFGFRGRMQLIQNAYGYRFSRALGFNNQIARGYELYSIPAGNYWLLKADYRYPLWDMESFLNSMAARVGLKRDFPVQLYFNIFGDMAKAYRDYQNHNENNLVGPLLSGTGAGLDVLVFRRFLFSLQYSWNHRGEKGVFVHFSFNRE